MPKKYEPTLFRPEESSQNLLKKEKDKNSNTV